MYHCVSLLFLCLCFHPTDIQVLLQLKDTHTHTHTHLYTNSRQLIKQTPNDARKCMHTSAHQRTYVLYSEHAQCTTCCARRLSSSRSFTSSVTCWPVLGTVHTLIIMRVRMYAHKYVCMLTTVKKKYCYMYIYVHMYSQYVWSYMCVRMKINCSEHLAGTEGI